MLSLVLSALHLASIFPGTMEKEDLFQVILDKKIAVTKKIRTLLVQSLKMAANQKEKEELKKRSQPIRKKSQRQGQEDQPMRTTKALQKRGQQ